MKKVVRCRNCAKCAAGYETGFAGGEVFHCSLVNGFVDGDDGCTMGSVGKPSTLCMDYDIDVSQNAAVWGWS